MHHGVAPAGKGRIAGGLRHRIVFSAYISLDTSICKRFGVFSIKDI